MRSGAGWCRRQTEGRLPGLPGLNAVHEVWSPGRPCSPGRACRHRRLGRLGKPGRRRFVWSLQPIVSICGGFIDCHVSTRAPVVKKIRVMLVDDNASYRQRMARLLQTQVDLEVVGEASEGQAAVARARELQPDVILIDFRMTGLDGYTAARAIVKELPQAKVFMLTAFPGALDPEKVAHSGLQGLLVKDQPAIEIIEAIRKSVETLEG